MKNVAIILISGNSLSIAQAIQQEFPESIVYAKNELEKTIPITSITDCTAQLFHEVDVLIFIGAMGICVRSIAPHIQNKYSDPAVINIDSSGKFAISVLSGHVGGANEWTRRIAQSIGAEPIITTQSDNNDLWALDTLGEKFAWTGSYNGNLNEAIFPFVNQQPTALLLDIQDEGCDYLERTCPEHVTLFYQYENIDFAKYSLFIAVTPYRYPQTPIPTLYFHPKVLHLGIGCRKNCDPNGVFSYISQEISRNQIAPESIQDISTIDIKAEEVLLKQLQNSFNLPHARIYTAEELADIEVNNPSEKVKEVIGISGVAEASAIKSADYGSLILDKQKGKLSEGNDFTFALAFNRTAARKGHIEIVGAGPGDPDLISVRGRYFLEKADLILYAGSLVPVELTYCAKSGALVKSSASMDLEEQFALMKEFYDKGKLVVRLHTGDPCIYGAIQEQMAFFDEYQMAYHITPGISSFQAAAAALKSQFTIPEKVQTIILTRGEGRTPMPDKEKLHLLARSQSTMCIFLSASIVDEIEKDLLQHYAPTTPIAACYKLTWKDERIYRGQLKDLAQIVKENQLTLTTMIVVGDAIDNRSGLSRLYSSHFKHLFRK